MVERQHENAASLHAQLGHAKERRAPVGVNVKVMMSLADHLRWLMAPGRDRWQPMLMGLALSAAAAGAAVLVQPSPVSLLLLALAFAAWFVRRKMGPGPDVQ